MENKKEIRRIVSQRINDISAECRTSAAEAIFATIANHPRFIEAQCIALFVSMHDEVSTDIALQAWRDMGKQIVVPRVEGDIMRFYDYDPATMQTGAFGIEEPMGDTEIDPAAIDLIIVPARAFTTKGDRLGRGGGYYDKYMSREGFAAYKIGIAFSCQIFDSLPTLPHDIVVDEVITEG
jgi:5-formyltetrahydrofolate cyclo-ligase